MITETEKEFFFFYDSVQCSAESVQRLYSQSCSFWGWVIQSFTDSRFWFIYAAEAHSHHMLSWSITSVCSVSLHSSTLPLLHCAVFILNFCENFFFFSKFCVDWIQSRSSSSDTVIVNLPGTKILNKINNVALGQKVLGQISPIFKVLILKTCKDAVIYLDFIFQP